MSVLIFQPKADVSPNPVAPFVANLMEHIVAKWSRNNKKNWIGNPKDQSESMHIDNNLLTIWAWALMNNLNGAVDKDNPPTTKHFVWIKKHTPILTELVSKGKGPETTKDNKPPKSPTSPLPNLPLDTYPRDPSPPPHDTVEADAKEPDGAPPAPSSDVEAMRRQSKLVDTSYDSLILLRSLQA
jgi:hypothetical protein